MLLGMQYYLCVFVLAGSVLHHHGSVLIVATQAGFCWISLLLARAIDKAAYGLSR